MILIVEDDIELGPMIVDFLNHEGFEALLVPDGAKALSLIESKTNAFDLMIFDVMLPNLNGVELCHKVRHQVACPILMLTAKNDELTEINSINRGADAYLKKPVRPHVLLAYVKSLLQKSFQKNNGESNSEEHEILHIQDIFLDASSLDVVLNEQKIPLTTAEFELLEYFLRNPGRLISRNELYKSLRGIEYDGLDRSIDMRISVLRKKMKDPNPPFKYIKTIRSKGYLLAKN